MFHGPFHLFRPRRHPLARLLSGVVGVLAVLTLVALGMFAAAALLVGGALFLLVNALRGARPRAAAAAATAPPPPTGIIEGEFTVVDEPARTRSPH